VPYEQGLLLLAGDEQWRTRDAIKALPQLPVVKAAATLLASCGPPGAGVNVIATGDRTVVAAERPP